MTDPKANGAPDWAALLAAAKPRTKTVRLCLRGDLLAQLADAVAAQQPSLGGESPDVAALRQQVEDASVPFVVKGLSRSAFRALEAQHPDPKGDGGWDMAQFPEALIRLCLVSPVIGPDQPLEDALTAGEFNALFSAAFEVSSEVDEVPLPKRG